ncbi:NAD-dependent epimerase/dehydratase family protein [Desulfitobacterium dichloroeliminans]|uniref:NAD-dependent epimerase/dehydratase family protein n=1 Tax=Desulfitobacterium dichloroeliminans TaxID=233055 RepID=UPI0003106CE0|nr:NAD(P)-dependent oxidoreductase [Desulfitobacterium dichloroeliminans]
MAKRVFDEDIERIISDPHLPWCEMLDKSVLITGATGLIGTALTRVLRAASKKYQLNLNLIGNGRNNAKGEKLTKECGLDVFIDGDIRQPLSIEDIPSTVDYIFHCAAITKSADMVGKPVDVITTAVDGTRNLLELAKGRKCKSIVYLSSMEVYGQSLFGEVRETDLGYIDLSNPRSSYPESKRLCETLCVAYAVQHGVPVKIARLAQTFGAGTSKEDTRVFTQFAQSVLAGKDIVLHTEGKSRGNYCYLADAVQGLLTLLLYGADGQAYNIANPGASVTIREMAELVASELGQGRIKAVVQIPNDIEKRGYAPDAGFQLNVDKLKLLGWQPHFGLMAMYKRMVADWQGQ